MAKPFTARALSTAMLDANVTRADIEFLGVDHAGSSYEGRVYVNNPDADETTEQSARAGYVGSYHVFGHGGCLGDPGHCDVRPLDDFDPRRGHPLTRARKVVIGNDVLRDALVRDDVTVTIVPLIRSPRKDGEKEDDVVKVDVVRIVTYR